MAKEHFQGSFSPWLTGIKNKSRKNTSYGFFSFILYLMVIFMGERHPSGVGRHLLVAKDLSDGQNREKLSRHEMDWNSSRIIWARGSWVIVKSSA